MTLTNDDGTYNFGSYFIIEHPTRGTFREWSTRTPPRPGFSWSGMRSDASKAKQYRTADEAQADIDMMPEHIGELCRIRDASQSWRVVQVRNRNTAVREVRV